MEISTLCTTLAEGTYMCTLGWEVCCKSHVLYACVCQICLRGKGEYIVQKCFTNFSSSTKINLNHVALERHFLGLKLFLKVWSWSPLPKTIISTSMESLKNSKILCYFTDCLMTTHRCFSLYTVPSPVRPRENFWILEASWFSKNLSGIHYTKDHGFVLIGHQWHFKSLSKQK